MEPRIQQKKYHTHTVIGTCGQGDILIAIFGKYNLRVCLLTTKIQFPPTCKIYSPLPQDPSHYRISLKSRIFYLHQAQVWMMIWGKVSQIQLLNSLSFDLKN